MSEKGQSTEVVELLREAAGEEENYNISYLLCHAAGTIERLRKQLAREKKKNENST